MVTVSAERGDGLDELVEAISKRLVPDPPRPREAVPFRRDQLEILEKVCAELLAARTSAAAGLLMTMVSRDSARHWNRLETALASACTVSWDSQRLPSAGGCGIRPISGPISIRVLCGDSRRSSRQVPRSLRGLGLA